MAGLTAASLPASAQINARISPDLKARGDAASEERSGRAEAMRRGSMLVQDAYLAAGVPWPSGASGQEPTYDELKELAYAERYGETMGWS